ncbi:MAG: RNA 2'-phosphotransferase [Neomegalonema sp.]|nr:RNA 2'-phosphotransferase [Neomegalonema sp.]
MTTQSVRRSKFLSLVLRHKPEVIDLTLDPAGWAEIDAVIAKAPADLGLDHAIIQQIVADNDKKRFEISADGGRIRAVQGHSLEVELDLTPKTPPALLYHGTTERFLDSIFAAGLAPSGRQYVHLTAELDTARIVGARHGAPVILAIDTPAAIAAGQAFFQAKNGVWLTGPLAPMYLHRLDD